jgi:hypothetical protein
MEESTSPSFGRRVLAVVVLAIAAWILFKFAFGFIAWLATVIVVIAAIAGVVWAIRQL